MLPVAHKDDPPKPPALPLPANDGTWDLRQALPAFGRRAYPMGSLTVVAPLEMTLLADMPPTREPNFWGGSSRYKRILYLLSSLASGQWTQLGSPVGLGISDLGSREQKEVFLSRLPDPMVIRTTTVTAKGYPDYDNRVSRTLTATERSAVHLRAQRSVRYELQDRVEDSSTLAGDDYYGEPGDTRTDWLDSETVGDGNDHRTQAMEVSGLPVLTRTRNTPRPSDFDYTSAPRKQPISLQATETVAALVSRIGVAVGRELITDIRVASLTGVIRGERAAAGDMLQALAFAVCGTWRHVASNTYVLTADRVGAGTRHLRLANWQAELDRQAMRVENEWMQKIAKSGGIKSSLRYMTDDPLKPSDEILTKPDSLPIWTEPSSRTPPGKAPYLTPMRCWAPGGGETASRFFGLMLQSASDPEKRMLSATSIFAIDLSPLPTAEAIQLLREWVKGM